MSDDLQKLALKLGQDGPVKSTPAIRMIQLLLNGIYIIRTTKAIFVHEHEYYPQLYIPLSEFTSKAAHPSLKVSQGQKYTSPTGELLATQLKLQIGPKTINNVLAFAADLSGNAAQLSNLVKIDFDSIDKWFEEDTQIYIHPKDPFKRVDILQSSRHIRVRVGGKIVADSQSCMHLYETGLPCRYYLPLTSIDASVLRPSQTKTGCPYKGEAEYYHVNVDGKVYEDVVWYYTRPLLESIKIEGLCCFYNEKVEIELNGQILDSPETPFSNRKPNDKPSFL
ncbi:uncharacterized protein RCC_04146 [Ramularia collo-cygni]|uniref:DUF427 domain-containing protein n=1 Tax=Ramularia collo-cygni TaxID=112498 RepID=A0A2D3UPB3_9PEZI|nr:uncharacterized protein RCC_04146 [Ramularia collo-cygni]CZT18302.1 uncharacterized protein RCC_04146 [Ramularia collo-cygni]